ncbi:MAG: ectoine synthase [Actinomycetota bacterium]|jgi:L-ectoine synthase|nr:ectoine synthase [Actinomycetota bacterium]
MIVRNAQDIRGTPRDVEGGTWQSLRLLLAGDGTGYSLHDTVMRAGTSTEMWYRHHVEAVYCVAGRGTLRDLDHGTEHPLEPGTLYVLDGHERHVVDPVEDLRMLCVFTPPCTGRETHLPDGSYPLLSAAGSGDGGGAR